MLRNDAVNIQPIDFDFSEGFGETWEIVYPNSATFSREFKLSDLKYRGYETDELEDDDELNELFEQVGWEDSPDELLPMMNFAYKLPSRVNLMPSGDLESSQARLVEHGGSVTLVTIHDEPYIALTGGGMDLSWDICGAYVLLGFLPPLHFCDLPHFAGLKLTKGNRAILDACLVSAEIAAQWANRAKERLEEYKIELEEKEKAWRVTEQSGATLEN